MIAKSVRDEVIDALWPSGMSRRLAVWMILDGARDKRIFGAVDGSYLEKTCLYAGDLPWQLQMAAPYLVQLDREDRLTEYVIDHGWGQAWGVFFRSESDLRTLRRHLRGFLRVRDREGRRLLFRYYDPRVLRVYLPTCEVGELRTVFGPIDQYLTEAEEPGSLIQFSFDGRNLSEKRLALHS